jgi:hypothetical protein
MQECILPVSYIYKRSIEAWHQLPDPSDENIADGKVCLSTLLMNLDKPVVVEQCDIDICRTRADNQLLIHVVRLIEQDGTKGWMTW